MSAGEAKYPAAAAAAAVVHPLGSCSACGQAVTTLTGFVNPSCPTAQPMHFACAVCNHCVAHRGKGLFAGATEYQRTAINSLGETLGVVFGFSPAEYDDFLVLPTKTYNVPPMIYSTGRIELLAPLPKPPRRPPPPPPPPPPAAAAAGAGAGVKKKSPKQQQQAAPRKHARDTDDDDDTEDDDEDEDGDED